MKRLRIAMDAATAVKAATAMAVVGALVSAPAHAALTEEAAATAAKAPLYLPASPADPGGLKGYNHGFQIDFAYEADVKGKNKDKKDKLKAIKPKKAVAGPKVKSGTYTLAPAPGAEPD
ncbi:hypothetical protein [Cupriavidus consociatus]|uniref:hypothetical protein n=1 Tax=Cupriavidus consociatus TaxID=2821357 RepID=UPI001FD82921|nr:MULTISPECIES: hypothetical protein [unclassified Cupriavidus]MDK2661111.1 hypothetical protein [Cupriavidus sp. LEh21]